MSWKTPCVSGDVLHEPLTGATIIVESRAWYAWLEDEAHCGFHFDDPLGSFTARKERKQRGQQYWIAYRQLHGKLFKVYLGKSDTLTLARLRAATVELARHSTHIRPSSDGKEETSGS